MKRNFLLLSAFFLSSCVSDAFQMNASCPITSGKQVSVLFEYDSAELNEKAVKQLKNIAREAQRKNQFVCFLGRLSYQGVPSNQALGAVDRARNVAAIFLEEGVKPTKIYIGISAENPRIGLSKPQTAADEEHVLNLLIGIIICH